MLFNVIFPFNLVSFIEIPIFCSVNSSILQKLVGLHENKKVQLSIVKIFGNNAPRRLEIFERLPEYSQKSIELIHKNFSFEK